MTLEHACANYLHGFAQLFKCEPRSPTPIPKSKLEIASYFTLLVPLGALAAYSIASLCGRISKKMHLSSSEQAANMHGTSILGTQSSFLKRLSELRPFKFNEITSAYAAKFLPTLNQENLVAYNNSQEYQRHAASARIYYNSSQLQPEDALRVVFQREPTNIAMGPGQYNRESVQNLFGYSQSVYNDTAARKTDGSSFAALPNTAAVYSETFMWGKPGQQASKEVACLSIPAPALDSTRQPHYSYYVKGILCFKKLDRIKYSEEMHFLFNMIERALRDNRSTAFNNRGIQRLVLSKLGQSAFLGALSSSDRHAANAIFREEMATFLNRIHDLKIPVVMSEYKDPNAAQKEREMQRALGAALSDRPDRRDPNDPKSEDHAPQTVQAPKYQDWYEHMIYGDIIETSQEGDFIINPWDPHSAPGNGNDADKSFDGAMGKGSGILLTQTSWLNPRLRQLDCAVAV